MSKEELAVSVFENCAKPNQTKKRKAGIMFL